MFDFFPPDDLCIAIAGIVLVIVTSVLLGKSICWAIDRRVYKKAIKQARLRIDPEWLDNERRARARFLKDLAVERTGAVRSKVEVERCSVAYQCPNASNLEDYFGYDAKLSIRDCAITCAEDGTAIIRPARPAGRVVVGSARYGKVRQCVQEGYPPSRKSVLDEAMEEIENLDLRGIEKKEAKNTFKDFLQFSVDFRRDVLDGVKEHYKVLEKKYREAAERVLVLETELARERGRRIEKPLRVFKDCKIDLTPREIGPRPREVGPREVCTVADKIALEPDRLNALAERLYQIETYLDMPGNAGTVSYTHTFKE